MRLKNDREVENSQRKLAELVRLIASKERFKTASPARDVSLDSMRRMADRIRAEIEEYERAHQHI